MNKGVYQILYNIFRILFTFGILIDELKGDGNVGCLFKENVCIKNIEWCFDDNAFGRCVPRTPLVDDDLYRYRLSFDDLEKFKHLLGNFRAETFDWKNSYTQCIIQNQLYAIKLGTRFDEKLCEHLMLKRFDDPIRELKKIQKSHSLTDFEPENSKLRTDKEGLGYERNNKQQQYGTIRNQEDTFTSLTAQQQRDIANELLALRDGQTHNIENDGKYYGMKKKANYDSSHPRYRGTPLYVPKHRLSAPEEQIVQLKENFDTYVPRESKPVYGKVIYSNPEGNLKIPEDWITDLDNTHENQMKMGSNSQQHAKSYTEGGPVYVDENSSVFDDDSLYDDYDNGMWGFQRRERLDVKKPGPYFKINNYAFKHENVHHGAESSVPKHLHGKDSQSFDSQHRDPTFNDEHMGKQMLQHMSQNREIAAVKFQNQEYAYVPGSNGVITNVDKMKYVLVEFENLSKNTTPIQLVNKIGQFLNLPPATLTDARINEQNLIFKVNVNSYGIQAYDIKKQIDENKQQIGKILHSPIIRTKIGSQAVSNDLKQELEPEKREDDDDVMDTIRITFEKPVLTLGTGEQILTHIRHLSHLPEDVFHFISVDYDNVTFKVEENIQGLNAFEVAKVIDSISDGLEKENISIKSISVISDDRKPAAVPLEVPNNTFYVLIFAFSGLICALILSAGIWCYSRSYARKLEKMKNMSKSKSDTNHKKDYQELCRSRMGGKPTPEPGQRITSLSKESDQSPSSRSSTSSWSEEPITNMDITTGHMVLTYMEDHLTNKARLDTEWAALCAYEADPCSVSVAHMRENFRKNRFVNAVPYDHARIVLNALSNVSGSDYINASTITDHDPRNPAYIASQGPLPTTTIDFWQMIWEQGCVVIVMLTRLVESDVALCHRYWPQEGSELYNIYEIHLVSEHIWCDDFLVRSFYLKNLKTTETRTVTQFHFLTWPEGGVPPATKPLLEFRRKVNKSFRGRSCPIVVHCSDGVGRTGSYLLLDMVLNRISKGAKEIDIAATLEHIRDQRAAAVSTKQQFQFVLSAVAEEVQAILKALPQQQPSMDQQVDAATISATSASTSTESTVISAPPSKTTDEASSTASGKEQPLIDGKR